MADFGRWGRRALVAAAAALLALAQDARGAFHPGDYVPTARRGQFHGVRTEWHDALGRYCPRFAVDRTVAMPIPRPKALVSGDEYKLSLAFEGEHFVTPWLRVLGGNLDKVTKSSKAHAPIPMVHVTLTRTHDKLVGVRAAVVPLPVEYAEDHVDLLEEYYNASAWPKHVIVRYDWNERVDVAPMQGAFVLMATTVGLALVVLAAAVRRAGVGASAIELLASAVGEEGAAHERPGASSSFASGGAKGD